MHIPKIYNYDVKLFIQIPPLLFPLCDVNYPLQYKHFEVYCIQLLYLLGGKHLIILYINLISQQAMFHIVMNYGGFILKYSITYISKKRKITVWSYNSSQLCSVQVER